MEKLLTSFALMLFFSLQQAKSQPSASSVIAPAGEHFESADGSLSWTLGEIVSETYSINFGHLTQGFHQPLIIRITGLEKTEKKSVLVYPNPVRDFIQIEMKQPGQYTLELFNLQGQRVHFDQTDFSAGRQVHRIDMQNHGVAVYLLRITNTIMQMDYRFKIEKY